MKANLFLFKLFLAIFWAACSGTERVWESDEVENTGSDAPLVQSVYLIMDETDLNRLYSRNPLSDVRLPGAVRWSDNGGEQKLRGVRFFGGDARYHPKKSLDIRFTGPQEVLSGSDRLRLYAMYADPSGMREHLAWEMHRELDLPAPHTRYAALHINGIYEGLGIHIQKTDSLFLTQNGLNPKGTLVRDETEKRAGQTGIQRQSAFGHDFSAHESPGSIVAGLFHTKYNPDIAALTELLQWVHDTPAGAEFYEGLHKRFDVENLTDRLSISYLSGNVNDFRSGYMLYRGTEPDSRWKILSSEQGLNFGRNAREGIAENRELGQYGAGLAQLNDFFAYEYPPDDAGWDNQLLAKYHQTPQLREAFEKRMLYLMDEVFTPEWFSSRIESIREELKPWMTRTDGFELHERQHHGEVGKWEYHLESIGDFIELRYAFIRSMLLFDEPMAFHNRSSRAISESGAGRFLFTDDAGWTVAAIDIEKGGIIGEPEILFQLIPAYENDGIKQNWNVEVSGGSVEGTFTLYYRNDIARYGRDNYYNAPEAVGRQWELQIIKDGEPTATRPNPYSNKVSANLKLSGEHVLKILHQE